MLLKYNNANVDCDDAGEWVWTLAVRTVGVRLRVVGSVDGLLFAVTVQSQMLPLAHSKHVHVATMVSRYLAIQLHRVSFCIICSCIARVWFIFCYLRQVGYVMPF